jgi:serine protease Do
MQKTIPFAEDLTSKPTTQANDMSLTGDGASLGVVPEYGEESIKGVRITGTLPNSPAARAGLQPGDIVIQLGAKRINNIYDLTDALNSATPNRPTTMKIVRNGQELTVQAILSERRREE